MCPFSSLAFLQPTTVDKEPKKEIRLSALRLVVSDNMRFLVKVLLRQDIVR